MAAADNTFRVTTAIHGATAFPDTIGGSIDEEIGYAETRPAARLSPATAMDSYSYKAVVECSMRFTPIVRNTKATLTFTLLKYDNSSTGTVSCANALAGEYHADLNGKPHKHSQHFTYDAANTENIAPISFT